MSDRIGKIGAWAGLACAAHCMAMPLLVTVLPVIGMGFLHTGWFEILLLGTATLLSVASLCWGYRKHKRYFHGWFLVAGLIWFVTGHAFGHSVIYSLVGGACFLTASIINHRLCKTCGHCESHCHDKKKV